MAEYLAVPEHIVYHLPDKVSYEIASVIEPLAIAMHAVNRSKIRFGDHVMVTGCGTIGLLIIKLLNMKGCGSITALDIDAGKLDKARKNGASHTIDPVSDDISGRVIEFTGGKKMDTVFEAVGISDTVNYSIQAVKKGGDLILVGNVQKTIEFPLQHIVTNEISINTSCASTGEYEACISLIDNGKVDLSDIVSITAPLSDGAKWLEKLHSGLPGVTKIVLVP